MTPASNPSPLPARELAGIEPGPERVYDRPFFLLCGGTVLFMASFGMLLPELPAHLAAMGGEAYLGGVVGMFTLAAFLARFISGRIADRAGRRKVMLVGSAVTAVAGFGYLVATTIATFMLLRFFHGLSTGFRPPGTSAMLADRIPKQRRGEALGYLGVAGNAGMATGPALGSWLTVEWGIEWMFVASALLGMASVALTFPLEETLPEARPVNRSDFNLLDGGLIDPKAWPAALVLLPVALAFGIYLTITPDFVDHLGYVYKGSFNTIIVVSSIAMRFIAGRMSDRHGRIPVLLAGTALMTVGMVVLGSAETKGMATLGALLYGASIGINMPTVFAWTTDLAQPGKIALALGTMLMALEVGIGAGALYSGMRFQGVIGRIPELYYVGGFGTAIAAIALLPPLLKGRRS
ncbi:MAG: MFS transporter [Bacteroidota bacterium]|nr:MFS transporter [Bacteroidota bacterium]